MRIEPNDHDRSAVAKHSPRLGNERRFVGEVMKRVDTEQSVDRSRSDRQRVRNAANKARARGVACSMAEHSPRRIDADHSSFSATQLGEPVTSAASNLDDVRRVADESHQCITNLAIPISVVALVIGLGDAVIINADWLIGHTEWSERPWAKH